MLQEPENCYRSDQLKWLIQVADLNHQNFKCEPWSLMAKRSKLRDTFLRYQLQEQGWEQYQASFHLQEKIVNTFQWLKDLSNLDALADKLVSQFDEVMLINSVGDQLIEFYYRSFDLRYIQLATKIRERFDEFSDFLQRKLQKDIKLKHKAVNKAIKILAEKKLLQKPFLQLVYSRLVVIYWFSIHYAYNDKATIVRQINDILYETDFQGKSQSQMNVMLTKRSILADVQNASCKDLYHMLQVISEIEMKVDFKIETFPDEEVFDDILFCVAQHKWPVSEIVLSSIIVNKPFHTAFIVQQLIQQFYISKGAIHLLISLLSNQEFKGLFLDGNSKKPLVKETFLRCLQQEFQLQLGKQQDTLSLLGDQIFMLYNNRILNKQNIEYFIKELIKGYLTNYCAEKQVNLIKESLKQLNAIKSTLAPKQHKLELLKNKLQKVQVEKQFNWFDYEDLISLEVLQEVIGIFN